MIDLLVQFFFQQGRMELYHFAYYDDGRVGNAGKFGFKCYIFYSTCYPLFIFGRSVLNDSDRRVGLIMSFKYIHDCFELAHGH